MSLSKQTFPRIAVVALLGVAAVFACGPFFGIEVLQNRQQILLAPPTISFETELRALVPSPTDKLAVVESGWRSQNQKNRATVEARELTPSVLAHLTEMWAQNDGGAAYALGNEVPSAIRLYTAGAVSFERGQTALARTYFQNVLSLSLEGRNNRELWSRFMLGRVALEQGNQAEAAVQFEDVRALVRQGLPDQLGLAVASFGEQARGAWRQGDIASAVELYARQASYGSQSGANSLVTLAGLILNDQDLLGRAIQDARARRLLFICLNSNSGRLFFTEPTRDAASKIGRLVSVLESKGLTRVEGAGLLASAAYSQGSFEVAQKLAVLEDVPISAWVLAKLALRRGDRATALREYGKALNTFEPAMGDPTGISTEFAILHVSRGDYMQALDLFYRAAMKGSDPEVRWRAFADYWGDAAYIAERVLTIAELQDYVDHKIPLPTDPAWDGKAEKLRLRSILGRRLMRAGRRREGLRYFDDEKVRNAAEEYDDALSNAASWWRLPLTKANAWFTAATLARNSGIEILGFEKAPDFAMLDGEYLPYYSSDEPDAVARNQQKAADPYWTADERKRVAASGPERDVRFQYRLTAVDEAMKSADLLPPHSQAFAAVLCEATRWVIDRQPKRAEQIYRRYLHEGAYVAWARGFGRTCPQPDFAAAAIWNAVPRQITHLARHARVHRAYAGLSILSLLTALAVPFSYLRSRRLKQRLARKSNSDGAQN